MLDVNLIVIHIVHCRTGSLEILLQHLQSCAWVHCRTGSLEIVIDVPLLKLLVHCRTGSLEKAHSTK